MSSTIMISPRRAPSPPPPSYFHCILHNLCVLCAIFGSISYVILPIIGSPTSNWCLPLLIAATICKLFATTNNNYNNCDDDDEGRTQKDNPNCGSCCWPPWLSNHECSSSSSMNRNYHHYNLRRRWQLRRMLREQYYRRVDEHYKWKRMMNNNINNNDCGGVDDRTPSPSDHSDGSSNGGGGGIVMLPLPSLRSSSRCQRFKKNSIVNGRGVGANGRMRMQQQQQHYQLQKQSCIPVPLRRLISNKNNNTILLSIGLILLPSSIYFLKLILTLLLTQSYKDDEDDDHSELANTIGKFGGSFLCLLLFPLSQYNSLFTALGLSEVHALRLHIFAGTGAILAGLGHGLYYIVIWLGRMGYRRYDDVFPDGECWKDMILEFGHDEHGRTSTMMMRLLHNGEEEEEEEEKDCQSKFIDLLGVLGGTFFLILGLSSMYSLRRRNYQLFYNIHVALSILLLFVLVMHYNKMIYYIAPGLLHYMALRLPIGVESWFKSKRYPGGVQVKKITCIPDSGGCVDIEFALSGLYDNDDNDFNDDDNMEVKDEDGTMSTMAATDVSAASNGEDEGRRRRRLGRKSPSSPASAAFHDEGGLPSNNNYQAAASYNRSIHDTVGKYIKLHIPDLSSQSHPFTIFAQCCTPTTRRQSSSSIDSVHILFRPIGSFTKSLSKRLQALTLHSLPESHGRIRSSRDKSKCPKMFMNGMRCNTLDMFRKATMAHDKVIIIAGGVGIVPYISLIHAIRQHSITTTSNMMHAKKREEDMMNDESIIVKNHLRLIYNDGEVEDDEEEDYGERKRIEDMEQNFSDGTLMSSPDSNSTKCIEVHWMSRDEGLIRHVVKNYLEPHCHADDELTSNDMRRYNSNSPPSCPITINFVVHHTSLKSSTVDQVRIESNSNSNDADSDESDPTTWAPSENHVSMEVGGDISPEHYAFPTSVYEGNRSSPIPNVMPTVTYTSIVFGGMRIVNYCYTHIQNKKVFQTRPIAVVGIVAFAMVASLVSYGVILLGELSYSKLFAYAKIGTAHANHDVNSEIEFGLVSDSVGREQIEWNDDNDDGNEGHSKLYTPAKPNTLSSSCHTKDRPAVMSISHRQGRPDLEALLQNAVKGETHEDIVDNGSSNVGIFMCGPNVMSNSVWKAIKSVENGQSCCSRGTSIAVYQEGFEL